MPKPTTTLLQLVNSSPVKHVSAGSSILYQGEIPRHAFVIKSGVVKAYSIARQGEERIVTFDIEGDMFPSVWVIGNASSSLYYYQALTDCEIYTVPREILLDKIKGSPTLTNNLMQQYIINYAGSLMRITALEQTKAREKILFTLYYLLQRYGKEVVPGWHNLRLTLTHQMIADLVGLTRETTAVELNLLKQEKILSYKRQKYLIHRERLLKLIGEDSFRDLQI